MDEQPRKRPSPARDSLEILRRIEPELLQAVADVMTLRQELAGLAAAVEAEQVGEDSALGGGVTRLSRGLDQLAGTHERLSGVLEQLHDGQVRFSAGQSEILEGVGWLREGLSEYHAESSTSHETLGADLERLHQTQERLAADQMLQLEGQKILADLIVSVEERVRVQGQQLREIRKELGFLPVIWTLAALVFAAAGAGLVILQAYLS